MSAETARQLRDVQGNLVLQQYYDPATDAYLPGSGATSNASIDARGFAYTLAPNTAFRSKRAPTITPGVFSNVGQLNVAPNGTMGAKGDIITRLRATVKTVGNGAKAAIWLTQLGDSTYATGTAGAAVSAGTSLTLTAGAIFPADANALVDRLVTFKYLPNNSPVAHWGMATIASHVAITTTSIALTVNETLEAGGVITEWIIHGTRARQLMEPTRTPRDEPYLVDLNIEAETGGFQLWHGTAFSDLELTGLFTG